MVQVQHPQDVQERAVPPINMVNLVGAVSSLVLVAGVAIWGYKAITRDLSGVPVVRAAEGPMRVQPENPGGQQADHQGLSVNDVAAAGVAGKPADRLILAPKPLDLTLDDVAAIPTSVPAETSQPSETRNTEAADVPADTLDPVQLAVVESLANQLSEGVDPTNLGTTGEDIENEVAPAPVTAGLKRSLRPRSRPAGLRVASLDTVTDGPAATLTETATSVDVDPATIPVGTRLAQLGAFASPEIARQEWDKLHDRFGDYMEGKGRLIQKASSGGRTFYRLRATGFTDLSDARRFCSALVAERADCIPVVTR